MGMTFKERLFSPTTVYNVVFFFFTAILTWLFYVARPLSINDSPNISPINILYHFIQLFQLLPTFSLIKIANLGISILLSFIFAVPLAGLTTQVLMIVVHLWKRTYITSRLLFTQYIFLLIYLVPFIIGVYFWQDNLGVGVFILLATFTVFPVYVMSCERGLFAWKYLHSFEKIPLLLNTLIAILFISFWVFVFTH